QSERRSLNSCKDKQERKFLVWIWHTMCRPGSVVISLLIYVAKTTNRLTLRLFCRKLQGQNHFRKEFYQSRMLFDMAQPPARTSSINLLESFHTSLAGSPVIDTAAHVSPLASKMGAATPRTPKYCSSSLSANP